MSDLIPWDSDRFVIRQYLDTNAVYIYDRIDNLGYVNQTETARLCEVTQQALSKTTKKTPKDLKRLLQRDCTPQPENSVHVTTIQNPNGGANFECFDQVQFWALLNYYGMYASGNENRDQAKELICRIGQAGSLAFILHHAGVRVQPVLDQPVELLMFDAIGWLESRQENKVARLEFTDVLLLSWQENNWHWTKVEGLTKDAFYAKWTDYVYSMLFGTNAAGLRKVAFCPDNHSVLIGRNHLSQIAFLEAVGFVEEYVAMHYDSHRCNNLKWLIVKGARKAHRLFKLPESPKYLETVEWLPAIAAFKPNALPGSTDDRN